ncbi:MAG TPA: LamG domain-containing protein, partial [Sedimentisphaerales bacterium]|nr:LamG domain-containing protein [Sedimentisphaerales bacterium]
MCRKLILLICVLLVAALSGPARAARWTGGGDGTSWYDSDNWDPNFPGQYEDADINSPPGQGPRIDGDVECGIVRGPCYNSNVAQGMDILSGNVKMNGMWRFKNEGTGLATVNITGGDITVGGDWRWSDDPDTYAVVNVTGASVTCPRLKIGDNGGGELYIGPGAVVTVNGECSFSGNAPTTLTVDGGLLDVKVKLEPTTSQVKINLDAGTIHCATLDVEDPYAIDINEGVLIIDGNMVAQIESDIVDEYITAYDGASGSEVHVEYAPGTDQTTVWATTIYTWARHPSPDDGAKNLCADNVDVTWTPGVYAAEHDVYFGTDYDDVKNATTASAEHRIRQEPNSYDASALETLEPGETYYWRIDEVNDNAWAPSGSPWKGKVWSFSINDGNAFDPDPAHNKTGVPLDATLGWMPGCSANSHDVYFGTAYEEVRDAGTLSGVFRGNQGLGETTYDPCDFDYLTDYYWRIDEVNGPSTLKGPVWKFRSQSAIVDVNMLLWYKFDETDGMTAGDSSGYEKDASVVGTTSVEWDPNGGRFDGCIHFREEEALVVPSDALHTVDSAITVSVWFNIDSGASLSDDYVIFDAGDLGSEGSNKLTGLIPDSAGDVVWRAGGDPCDVLVWADAAPAAWRGDWHHFGFRKSEAAGTMTIFFDGLPVKTRTGTGNTLSEVADTPFTLGCYNDENSGDYGGRMDDFRLFNRALSDTEVASLFRGGEVELPWAPSPYDGEVDVDRDVNLVWWPGNYAASHNVYFGTSWEDVNSMSDPCATTNPGDENYNPGILELESSYYWRIDEVNGPNTWKGPVWRFTVADFLVLDDFEQYDTGQKAIQYTWYDQYSQEEGELTGAWLELARPP